jgi:hypothetical protein
MKILTMMSTKLVRRWSGVKNEDFFWGPLDLDVLLLMPYYILKDFRKRLLQAVHKINN